MAIAERMMAAHFPAVVDHHTYVLASDGDLMEGVSQEAIAIAGHIRLSKLIVFYDDNGISIDGRISSSPTPSIRLRDSGPPAGTRATSTGTTPTRSSSAIRAAQNSDKPTMIACKTTIGFGLPTRQGTNKAHGEALWRRRDRRRAEGAELALRAVRGSGRHPCGVAGVGARGAPERAAWRKRLAALDPARRPEFERRMSGKLPKELDGVIDAYKRSSPSRRRRSPRARRARRRST